MRSCFDILQYLMPGLSALAFLLAPAAAAAPVSAGPVFPNSRNANIGVVIRDLAKGEDIVSLNADKMLTPASILKCVTAASVFLAQKEDSCFYTLIGTEGEVDQEGTLMGNIVVRGAGDPTAGSTFFPETASVTDSIVAHLRRLGIKEIAGSVDIDSAAFRQQGPGPMWEVDDLKYGYGTGLYALNWNDNTRGGRSVAEPDEEFINVLESEFKTNGINVNWEDYEALHEKPRYFYTHTSPTAREILKTTMEVSNNLFAESMLRFLSPRGLVRNALDREKRLLHDAGLDTSQLVAYDGSGLTRANSLTPAFMADLLQTMAYSPKSAGYTALFPRAGEEGTVKNLLKDTRLAGRLVLKSGSMKGVYCYAGYLLNSAGIPTHAVVIMINDFTCPRAQVKKAIENFLLRELPA